jgi:hypothetical protein
MLRAIGIRMFSSPEFGRASLIQPELGPAYKSLTLTRLNDISEVVTGLRLPSPEVATLSAEFIGMVGTATIEGSMCVTTCQHKNMKSRAGQIIEKYRQKSLLIINKNFIFAHTKINLNGNL